MGPQSSATSKDVIYGWSPRERRKSLGEAPALAVPKVLSPPMARKPIPPPKPLFLLGKEALCLFGGLTEWRPLTEERESARH